MPISFSLMPALIVEEKETQEERLCLNRLKKKIIFVYQTKILPSVSSSTFPPVISFSPIYQLSGVQKYKQFYPWGKEELTALVTVRSILKQQENHKVTLKATSVKT